MSVLQISSQAGQGDPEVDEVPPGTDTTPESPVTAFPQSDNGTALPQSDNGTAEPSYAQQAAYWHPSAHHATPVYVPGWYYQDVSARTQGPFTKQQLQLWRQHLPMDLQVWYIDQNGGSSHSLELAKVLGDGRLLESWRKAQRVTVRLQMPHPHLPETFLLQPHYSAF